MREKREKREKRFFIDWQVIKCKFDHQIIYLAT
jgi:hypothetical protein